MRTFLLAASLTFVACSVQYAEPCPRGCPTATGTPPLVGGEVTHSIAGGPARTVAVIGRPTADATHCAVSNGTTDVKAGEVTSTGDFLVLCQAGGGGYTFRVKGLGDPRSFTVGTHPITLGEIQGTICVAAPGADRCTECAIRLTDVKANLVVEEATGGVAPYPKLVSPDYRRVYRVEIETGLLGSSEPPASGGVGGACATIRTKISARFAETAADWRYDPNGVCACDR